MTAVRHLGFLKLQNFTYQYATEGQYVSPCHVLCRSVELWRKYGRFSIFQDGFTCIWTTHEEYLLVFFTV